MKNFKPGEAWFGASGGSPQDSGYLKEEDVKLGQDYRGLEWPGSQRLKTGY